MTNKQLALLAEHLRTLAERLDDKSGDWTTWVIGNLIGLAEGIEIQLEGEQPERKQPLPLDDNKLYGEGRKWKKSRLYEDR